MPISRLTRAPGKAGGPADRTSAIRPALYAIAGAVTLSPLLWARVPALVDYPNHLARAWILVHATEIPALAGNYSVHWRILPDLAMDLVVSALAHLVSVELAGRIFVALTMAALIGGTIALHRVLHGRVGLWPLCSMLFVYNAVLFWGFVNCLLAIGIYLLVFSGWIATRHWRIGVRLILFSLAASLLFLLHLFAFGLYGLSMAAYELGVRLGQGRLSCRSLLGWMATWLQLLPGLALWRASLAHAGSTLTVYGGLAAKLYALIAPFDFGVAPTPFDRLVAVAACLGLILAIATRTIRLAPEMRLPLAAMAAAALLMPHRVSGAWAADLRLPVTLPFVVVAGTSLEISRRSVAAMAAGAGAILLLLRVWSVSQSWRDYDRWFTEFRIASAVVSPGARLLVAEVPASIAAHRLPGVPAFLARMQPVVFTHMAALAVIDRAVFFPYLFTGWTTIDVTPRNLPVSQKEGQPATLTELVHGEDGSAAFRANAIGELPYWRNWRQAFDFALVIDFGPAPQRLPESMRPVRRGSFFAISRVIGAQPPAADRQYDAAAQRGCRSQPPKPERHSRTDRETPGLGQPARIGNPRPSGSSLPSACGARKPAGCARSARFARAIRASRGVEDRADVEIDGLDRADGALDQAEEFVAADGGGVPERSGGQAGAHGIEPVEGGLNGDLGASASDGEAGVGDLEGEVLGHLAPVDHGADRQADLGAAAQRLALALDGGEMALGGPQEILALARALGGERMIAAQNQALALDVR